MTKALTLSDIENIVRKHDVVLDYSALFHAREASLFFDTLLTAVSKLSKKVTVSEEVLASDSNGVLQRFNDAKALAILPLKTDDILKTLSNVVLITADEAAISDVPKHVKVILLCSGGKSVYFSDDGGLFNPRNFDSFVLVPNDYPVPPAERLEVSEVPGEGDFVYLKDGERVKLTREISAGGEGTVYALDAPGLVAKIYHPDRLKADLMEKLKIMTELKDFFRPNKEYEIVWPQELVYNSMREFVGYIMPVAKGTPLQNVVFNPNILQKKYPHIKRAELVKIAINVLKALDHLYTYKVLVGDINALNILVDDNLKVYLIDSDSFQIGPFVCKVGRPEYSHPEWIDVRYESKPRSPKSEAFALAILIFMILLPGKHPFSQVGGEDTVTNIKNRFFPYVVKGTEVTTYDKAPVGFWRYIWSHTPPKIKQILHDVLVGVREPETFEELRALVNELIYHLDRYYYEIVTGKRTNLVFPRYYFIPDYVPKVELTCPKCSRPFEIPKEEYIRLKEQHGEVICPFCYKITMVQRKLSSSRRRSPTVIKPPPQPIKPRPINVTTTQAQVTTSAPKPTVQAKTAGAVIKPRPRATQPPAKQTTPIHWRKTGLSIAGVAFVSYGLYSGQSLFIPLGLIVILLALLRMK